MARRYTRDDLEICSFAGLAPDKARAVEAYCHTLDPDRDGGETPYGHRSTLAWIHFHNFEIEPPKSADDVASTPFGTVCAFDRLDGAFVGMGSIVTDDRNVLRSNGIRGDGMWGGVITPAEFRGRGVASIVCAELNRRCQAFANRSAMPATFHLFTDNAVAAAMYAKLGYAFQRQVFVGDFNCAEDLYSRTYRPE
eukprot:TRINITY_DN19957_c0_g1_i1.p1 TRINITY_DN19957_c0_g1~~TRINITY_DN19957_c0_g1_i1.p1  ORF type:complete len:195 (+),score=35.06 TRINITY_DN19957_c0_g1_i1:358-942(+)